MNLKINPHASIPEYQQIVDYFIIMPHYNNVSSEVLKILFPEKLFILDRPLDEY